MIARSVLSSVRDALARMPAVALIGPRQVGKTTLARAIADEANALYLDLESSGDRAKLADPALFLGQFEDRLVVLDEVHRAPEIFSTLRGLIDQGRRNGRGTSRFLILGSTAVSLLRQSSESLAGRIAYVEMGQLAVREVGPANMIPLWVRGGFPGSFLAPNDAQSLAWRRDFVRTYLERDIPQFGSRVPVETLERLWTGLAYEQGGMLNASRIGTASMFSAQTATRYVDLLVDLFLVRRLLPFHANVGKRLVKSPRVYVRDSGLVHALLSIPDFAALSGNRVAGASWEGFVIETLVAAAPAGTAASFYRTAEGAEIDLVLDIPGQGRWAFDIKLGQTARPEKGFYIACEDVRPDRRFLVNSGVGRFPVTGGLEAIGLEELAALLSPTNFEPENVAPSVPTAASAKQHADPSRYLANLMEECGHIDLRGLGQALRAPIDQLYVPLAFRGESIDSEEASLRKSRLVVVGGPGSGKSTLLRRVAWQHARDYRQGKVGTLFPVLMRVPDLGAFLRGLKADASLRVLSPELLVEFLGWRSEAFREGLGVAFFRALLEDGRAILLIDGLDEAGERREREDLVRLIENSARAYPDCRYLVATRPGNYVGTAAFGPSFQVAYIEPWDDERIHQFLHRWNRALPTEGPVPTPSLGWVARNPLMLTAVAVAYPHHGTDTVASILTWLARSRELERGRVSAETVLNRLRGLAVAMEFAPEGRKLEVEPEWAAQVIFGSGTDLQDALDFVAQQAVDGGILVARGSKIQFSHPAFQEFLAERGSATPATR